MNGLNGVEECQSYTTICRLCMQRDGFMLGIFNNIHGRERSICKKIVDCTALEITSGDGLPNSICHRCLYKIEFCLEFRQQCFISDATLRQINGLSKEIETTIQSNQDNNVVMVIDPNALDYESDTSEHNTELPLSQPAEPPSSDVETLDTIESYEYKNVHMCKYCDKAFTEKDLCAKHELEDHNTDTPYSCTVCNVNFPDRNSYSTHLKSEHQNDKPYSCPECERTFARRSDLRKHTIVHTGIKPFTCPICSKSFSRNTNLSKHIRIHKGQKPFVCHSCPRTFMTKIELTRHAVQHSGVKPFKCDKCHMSFMRKDKLLRHQKRHLLPEKTNNLKDAALELQAMRENLMNEYGMSDFTVGQDSNDNNLTIEPIVNNDSDDNKDKVWLNTNHDINGDHEDMVINLDPFSNDNELINNDLHTDGSSSPIKHDEFALYHPSVPDHITAAVNDYLSENNDDEFEKSSPTRKYSCLVCAKKFKTNDSLTLHMGLHNDERPFSCKVCGKSFLRKRELDRHGATHTGIKQFECTLCDKRFSRKDKLLRHTRIHEVNKEQCTICQATFNRKDGLIQHMKTHISDEYDDR